MPKRLSEEEKKARQELQKARERRRRQRENTKESKRLGPIVEARAADTNWWLSFGKRGNFYDRAVNGEYAPSRLIRVLRMIDFAENAVNKTDDYAAWYWSRYGSQRLKIIERNRATGKFVQMVYDAQKGPVRLSFALGKEQFLQTAIANGMSVGEANYISDCYEYGFLDDPQLLITASLSEVPA